MKKNYVLILIVFFIVSLIFTGCGGNNQSNTNNTKSSEEKGQKVKEDKKIVLKFGAVSNSKEPMVVALQKVFEPKVEELTQGKVDVQIFADGQLGSERDMMEQLQLNTLQMAYISPVLGSIEPKINILDSPFLFKDYEHVDKVIDGPIGKKILEDLPEKGLYHLGYFENGFRVITNSKNPINKLDDLKGLKIRTPKAPISVAIFDALGANVTPLAFTELYSALQQGVVDGQENPYNVIATNSFYDVQKYVAETNHMWGNFAILASYKWWNELSSDIQDAIQEAAQETSKYQRKIAREGVSKNKQLLIDKGMQVTNPDTKEFFEAVQPVYENLYKEHPEYKEIVDEILKLK